MDHGFIYITTNLINGKKYIGQHTKFKEGYLGSGPMIARSIKKYGRENFSREIIDYASSQEELDEKEMMYISKFNAVKDPMFYNIAEGGNVINYWKGKKRSEETKEKIRKSINKPEVKEKLSTFMSGKNSPSYGRGRSIVVFKDDDEFSRYDNISRAAEDLEKILGGKLYTGVKWMVNKNWKPKKGQMKGFSAMYLDEYEELNK